MKILRGASRVGKRLGPVMAAPTFLGKVLPAIAMARPIKTREAKRGKKPAPGERKDPKGYRKELIKIINPKKNNTIPT